MRATIKNYIEAEKARREAEGKEAGFSLIELIIVVVILGVLVAIAVPIFVNIQDQAELNAVKAAAANGATAAAADFAANGTAVSAAAAAASAGDPPTIVVTIDAGSTNVTNVCSSATGFGVTETAGPGC